MGYSGKNTVVVVDDHPLILEGIVQVVNKLEGFEVVGTAQDGIEGAKVCIENTPDLLIADIDMPRQDGVMMVTEVLKKYAWIKVVFLTSHVNMDTFRKALRSNFIGFLFKENALDELENCLGKIMQGHKFYGSGVHEFIDSHKGEMDKYAKLDIVFSELTKTEKKVLKHIAAGRTTGQIAEELFNSVKTIENHRYNICRKLKVDGSNALLCFAIENRLYIQDV